MIYSVFDILEGRKKQVVRISLIVRFFTREKKRDCLLWGLVTQILKFLTKPVLEMDYSTLIQLLDY